VNIDLSTTAPPAPEHTRRLAETFAEIARALNHQTRHPESLGGPADADRVTRELSSAASRLPQLLDQLGAWLERKAATDGITVPSGEYQGNPLLAVATVRLRMDMASAAAEMLHEALEDVGRVTTDLAMRGDGTDG
jgi:hypothetical protein